MADTPYVRHVSIGLAVTYLVSIGVCALLKATAPLMVNGSWSEVFYGPLIAIVSCLTLILIGYWTANITRGCSGSDADCEHE